MKLLQKIKLQNFKRFTELSLNFDDSLNILIGENESGKSTILSAIDIVLSGSRSKVENIGLENLFNTKAIDEFFTSDKRYESLPILFVELYLNDQNNPNLDGKINSELLLCNGLRLVCEPDDNFSKDIKEILGQDDHNFPYEFYSINFKTFSGETYTGYRKYMKHLMLDNTQISNEYATREYVKAMYNSHVTSGEKNRHQNEYRKHKEIYKNSVLAELNDSIPDYSFIVKTGSKANLETDLTISEEDVNIENKGKGKQCFIKTKFALDKKGDDLDVILIEEPENHLSHLNMKKLIREISESENKQIFIATHSNLISARLDLRKTILLHGSTTSFAILHSLSETTAKFFIKASNNSILEFILSKKVILVEGDAEYILFEAFYQKVTNDKLEDSSIHIISVGGTSFKRYLEVAKLLNIKTAVIRDNDKNYIANCVDNYSEYVTPFIKIFSEKDNNRYTFEIALYQDNSAICEELFSDRRRTLTVQDFMLQNKADSAFELLDKKATEINPPQYIREAIEWIKE